VLFFNDKLITDSMAPSGYQHLEDSPYGGVGSYIHFDDKAPRQLGTYDIYSIFISNGGNIQRRYPYILLAIRPRKAGSQGLPLGSELRPHRCGWVGNFGVGVGNGAKVERAGIEVEGWHCVSLLG